MGPHGTPQQLGPQQLASRPAHPTPPQFNKHLVVCVRSKKS